MTTNENLLEVLNDLVLINNDRITGYENASSDVENIDVDLKAIFTKMANQSRELKTALAKSISDLGGSPEEGTSAAGKIHRTWMDVKATFTGKDRQSALDSCEFGEDAAQKAYSTALASEANMSTEVRQLITGQKEALKSSHDSIKELRDANRALA